MAKIWIIGGLCLLPDGETHVADLCDIEVEDGRIVRLHRSQDRPWITDADEVIDAAGCLVIPGFVNAHTHSPDNLIRGTAPNLPLELWSLHSSAGREGRSPREVYVAALLGCIEMLQSGTTTVLDHVRFSPRPDPESLAAIAAAYRDIGIRAVIAPVVADRTVVETIPFEPSEQAPNDGGYGRAPLLPAAEQFRLIEEFAETWNGAEGRISAAIGPSGPQRCSNELLEQSADLSRRLGILLHMHLLETKAQREMGHRLYGGGMVRHLQALGLLSPLANLAHTIWLEPDDLEVIAASGAAVVHNPVSNAKLGSGFCPLPDLLRRGVRVALGTDSTCCNDSNNMLETAKWAALVHSLDNPDYTAWIGPERALRLATRGGADALGLSATTGAIEPGLAADLTFFRLRSPAFVPLHDPVRQLVESGSSAAVDLVMVAGRVLFRDGRHLSVAVDDIWAEAQELAEKRLQTNAGVYASASRLAKPIGSMYRRLHGLEG